ncbi:MAG: DUF3631 domain-containing protein [Pseudomonadota bacterium]|nr:DUF3631 domain-containing protein [Pseudomonadota bacterium]
MYEPEPWPDPVSGVALLDSILDLLTRFMVMRREDAIACALWAVHSHLFDVFSHTARLLITAPDAECGKTLLMSHLIGGMVRRPQPVELMKAAPFFRLAEDHKPCFLIDECDVFLREDSDLIPAINNGWEPHGAVPRCVGDDNEVRLFGTHTPVVLAGIDLERKLAPTTISRSIVVSLDRAAEDEIADKAAYDARQHKKVFREVGRKIARWCADNRERIARHEPTLPPKVRNRLADKWTPLFAIAEVAGGHWPKLAETALFSRADTREPSKALQLLIDMAGAFQGGKTKLFTKTILARLEQIEDGPWSEYNFRAREPEQRRISDRQMSALAAQYKVKPGSIRIGGDHRKGYRRSEMEKAVERYSPKDTPFPSGTPGHLSNGAGFSEIVSGTNGADVPDSICREASNYAGCPAVPDGEGGIAGDDGPEDF